MHLFRCEKQTLRLQCEKHRRCEQQSLRSQQTRCGHQTLRLRCEKQTRYGPENDMFLKNGPENDNVYYSCSTRARGLCPPCPLSRQACPVVSEKYFRSSAAVDQKDIELITL
ncbi:hypothetical protein AVEN_64740-1 [Araneus ventricosus]|uniref:Uncharacterized protein n=1 Tax=Araneus ventricosus TaxID=182803 RepID=A0A4Y2UGS2_ARAVE|nr:hypothetical protein AVEN_64740-1 [Araneus ventricosus]